LLLGFLALLFVRGELVSFFRPQSIKGLLEANTVKGVAALNSMRLPRSPFDQLADALVVSTPRTRFAAGGEVTRRDGTPVILQFPDGRSFSLRAEAETADSLGRYAVTRRLSAAGRKPSYYGAI